MSEVPATATAAATAATVQSSAFNLQGLTIEPVLNTSEDASIAIHGDFPHHKYEKILIHGFTTRLNTDEIVAHPLIRLLHDYKHLMLHGNRGNKNARAHKRKSKKPYENHFCRLGFVYTISPDPQTFDLVIRFVVDTAFKPIWTNFDGSEQRKMTSEDIARATANFIESFIAEARALIDSEATSCHIDGTTVIIDSVDDTSKTTTPPPETELT